MTPPSNALRYAWFVVALLFPVALLNYLDRQMLATMKASMVGDIPSIANKADWGLILGCFKWTYALLSPFAGYVADRVGKHRVIASSLFVWSLVTWWTGHVTSFQELLAARALMGVSEAFYIPAALALIADYHFGDTRSRAVGVHQTGIYIGQILGGFAGYVAEALREVPLPGAGTVGGPVEHIDGGPVCWLVYTDHTTLPTIYSFDARTGDIERRVLRANDVRIHRKQRIRRLLVCKSTGNFDDFFHVVYIIFEE